MKKAVRSLREGILLTEEAKSAKAITKFKKALEIFLKSKNQEMIALCLSFLGLAYRSEKQYDAALEQFHKFLDLITEMKDTFGIAQAYLDIGLTLSLQKRYDSAIDKLKKCLKIIQEELKDKDLEVRALSNLGGVYLLKGDLDVAFSYFKEGLQIADKFDYIESSAECYRGLAEIHEKQGDLRKSVDYYQNSLGVFRLLGDKRSESDILLQLGVIYSQLERYYDAIFYFKQGKKVKKQLKDIFGEKLCEKNLDILHAKLRAKKDKS
ncbi:MAG: tetratricopeptide repeat protein [Promethearchaeota archaeon]